MTLHVSPAKCSGRLSTFASLLVVIAAFSATQVAKATLLAYEGFNYPGGSAIVGQNGGFGFNNAWQLNGSGAAVMTNQGASLSYSDGFGNSVATTGGSLFIQGLTTGNTSAQPNRDFNFIRGTNGTDGVTTWFSFLSIRQGTTTNTIADNVYPRAANVSLFNNTTANTEKLATGTGSGIPSNVVSLLPAGNAGNRQSSSVRDNTQVNFIVVRIDHTFGSANDTVYLFVNPRLDIEPLIGSASAMTNNFDFSFNRIRPFAGGYNTGGTPPGQPNAELLVDELKIGETYLDVTLAAIPEPTAASLAGTGALTLWLARRRLLRNAGKRRG